MEIDTTKKKNIFNYKINCSLLVSHSKDVKLILISSGPDQWNTPFCQWKDI